MLTDGPAARALSAVLLVLAWVLTWRPALDPDLWWHLALGDRILAAGTVPTVEPWSWWSAGRTIVAHSWAWDVVVAAIAAAGGMVALSVLGALLSGIAIGLLWWLLRLSASTVPVVVRALLVIAAVLTALVSWSPRAQLLDLVAVLAVVIVLERYARLGRAVDLVALPVIALAWANLHGSAAPAGLAACLLIGALGMVVGERTGHWPPRPKMPFLVAGLVAVAALAVSPSGPGLLVYPLDPSVASAFRRDIVEWAPPDLGSLGMLGFSLALVAAVVALLVPTRRPRDPIVVLQAAAWTGLALTSARFVLIAGPLLVVAVGPVLAALLPTRADASPVTARTVAVVRAASALVIAAILVVGSTLIMPATQDRLVAAAFPVDAMARLAASDCDGRLLNAYDWGGYVLRHTDRAVGAYGNSPGDVVATQADLEAVRVDPRAFLDEQGVEVTLLKADGPLAAWFRSAEGWRVALDDGQALVAVRADATCQIT